MNTLFQIKPAMPDIGDDLPTGLSSRSFKTVNETQEDSHWKTIRQSLEHTNRRDAVLWGS